MKKVKIVTDSTVDLTNEIIAELDIEVIPLSLSINGVTYLDRVEISPSEFMHIMQETEQLPKSSQPPAGAFLQIYDKYGQEGYDVVSIHMTGGMSGTVQSAESAASMTTTNVTVIDSRYISKALSYQVAVAANMAKEGKTVDEIVVELNKVRENTRLFVVVDTLDNLVKGGRIGKGKALIGSLLNIKPIASLEGGVYTPVANARSHSQVVKFLLKEFTNDVQGKAIKAVGIVHADGLELGMKMKDAIEKAIEYEHITIEDTTPIISTHTGPGAIGFMYYFE